jgi:uncharacterized repeat protein (TIGR03806 family)
MTYDGTNPPVVVELLDTGWPNNYSGLSSFGVDNNNELFLCKMGRPSKIYKLGRTGTPPPPPPALLSQTGAFTNLATLAPAPELIPYDVNSPLWSDGAAKARWVAVPTDGAPYDPGETVGFAATGEWDFPVGTVFVKHFEMGINETNPSVIKRLETRFLVHATNNTWYGLTYKWRPDQGDADLLPGGLLEDIQIQTATTIRTQVWQYPSREDCLTCHNETANRVLGVKTRQLNGDLLYPPTGVTDNQLRAWNHIGLFNPALTETNIAQYDKLVKVTNETASLEVRVRSYLDANCAHCHRPNGSPALFDARWDTPLESQGLVSGPLVDPLGIAGAKVIKPQSTAQSILYLRDNTIGPTQMPPLAKKVIDTNYINVLTQWINSLPLPVGLPSPWAHQDVGNVAFVGDANYSVGAFTMDASGADIWGTADGFHFVHQPLDGDGTLVARVDTVENTHSWAKAGVMIRQSLTAGSKHAFMAITPGNGAAFQRRTSTGGSSTHTAGTSVTAPYWVRLSRSGNTFTGYQSADGQAWSPVGSISISMPAEVNVGLAVTSHDNSQVCTATFSQVSLTGPNVNTPPTISVIADQTTDEDMDAGPIGFTVGDAESSTATLTLAATSSNPSLITVSNITFGGSAENRSVTLTPLPDQSGSSDITITVSDGSLDGVATFKLTVTPVNDPPVFASLPATQTIVELASMIITNDATDKDVPAQTLSYSLLAPPSGASVDTDGVITWTPTEAQGPSTNTLTTVVSDGLASMTNSFVVTVTETNAAPAFAGSPEDVVIDELTLLTVTNAATDSDLPAQTLTYALIGGPTNASIDSNGVITWIPNEAQGPSTNTITTTVSDGLISLTNAFVATVLEVNVPPTAIGDLLSRFVTQGIQAPFSALLTNDIDADGDIVTLSGVISPTPSGASVITSNTFVLYQPVFGDTNGDTFNYVVADGNGGVATGLVTVTVQPDPAAMEVLAIRTDPGEFTLSFTGVPGFTYTVQYTDSLQSPAWQNLTTAVADEFGQVQTVDNSPSGGATRFYRAVRGIVP